MGELAKEQRVDDPLDWLVEAIRVASFEAPKAGSHSEWSRRIKTLFEQVGWCDPNNPMRVWPRTPAVDEACRDAGDLPLYVLRSTAFITRSEGES